MSDLLQIPSQQAKGLWPVLFGLAVVTLAAVIYATIGFDSECRELQCLGLITYYGIMAVSAVVCIIAAIGSHKFTTPFQDAPRVTF